MRRLGIVSCMTANSAVLCRTVAEILDLEAGIFGEYVTGIPWQERERLFDAGEIEIITWRNSARAPGQAVLESSWLERFVFAHDRDYDPIRRMARDAEPVSLA